MSKTAREIIANAIRDVVWVPDGKGDDPGTWDTITDDAKVIWLKAADESMRSLDAAGSVIEQGWQPISTRQPPSSGFDLCQVFTAELGIVVARQNSAGDFSCHPTPEDDAGFYLASAQEAGITHWRPMPEPPAP